MTHLPEPDLLDRLLRAVPRLERPVMLLESGAAHGILRLAWGDDPNRAPRSAPAGFDRLGELDWGPTRYGFLSYEVGLPPWAARKPPLLEHAATSFFHPMHEIHVDLVTGSLLTATDGAMDVVTNGSGTTTPTEPAVPPRTVERVRSFRKDEFELAVSRAKNHIAAGDVYQVNLSVGHLYDTDLDPWAAYLRLRHINPSPWMGFADFGDWQIVSGSPELLVAVDCATRTVRTRPIAGTRKKTGDAERDLLMRSELHLDDKEQAEHLMLVDLARNDIGRMVEYGSLEVSELAVIEEYSHVFHLVSEVRGTLRSGFDPPDVLRSIFPCGTITGVPKIRAMEVISDLEPCGRLGYTGGLGWVGESGMQFNILIRTAVFRGGQVVVQAGAGIVWDSVPEREWYESLRKARAVMEALAVVNDAQGTVG
ncbi:MAG: anthranilate synthase component I family protein [Gemmatimonadales bacterium]